MEKGFAHIVEVGRSELNKHLELGLLNLLEHVLFVVGLEKFSLGFSSSSGPGLGL